MNTRELFGYAALGTALYLLLSRKTTVAAPPPALIPSVIPVSPVSLTAAPPAPSVSTSQIQDLVNAFSNPGDGSDSGGFSFL